MNGKQKVARLVGMLMLASSALFPPWQLKLIQGGAEQSSSVGYHPLWNPPNSEVEVETEGDSANYRIDVVRLGVQLGLILLIVNGAVFFLRTKTDMDLSRAPSED